MKMLFGLLVFAVIYSVLIFFGNYAEENLHCSNAENKGADVVWIEHKLFSTACYINVTINNQNIHMDAYDWLKYLGGEGE